MFVILLNLIEPIFFAVFVWYFWPALKWYYQDLRETFKTGPKKTR